MSIFFRIASTYRRHPCRCRRGRIPIRPAIPCSLFCRGGALPRPWEGHWPSPTRLRPQLTSTFDFEKYKKQGTEMVPCLCLFCKQFQCTGCGKFGVLFQTLHLLFLRLQIVQKFLQLFGFFILIFCAISVLMPFIFY